MNKKPKKNSPKAPKSKKTQRKPEKLWGLQPLTFPKSAQEYIGLDEQYKKDLADDPKAAAFLSKFNVEVYGNTFKKGKGAKNLYKKNERKSIYDSTNARNRDMYNRRYRYQDIEYVASMENSNTSNPQDALIDYMDKKKKIQSFLDRCTNNGMTDKEAEDLASWVFLGV